MSRNARIPKSEDLLGGALGTRKRSAITGALARRAIESPEDSFTQTSLHRELVDAGEKILQGEVSGVFRFYEHHHLLVRNGGYHDGFRILQGEAQHNFWRAAQLMIKATEVVLEELPGIPTD